MPFPMLLRFDFIWSNVKMEILILLFGLYEGEISVCI